MRQAVLLPGLGSAMSVTMSEQRERAGQNQAESSNYRWSLCSWSDDVVLYAPGPRVCVCGYAPSLFSTPSQPPPHFPL